MTTAILNIDLDADFELEYETTSRAVLAEDIRVGDVYKDRIVKHVKRGTKWVYVTYKNDKTSEIPMGAEVVVSRRNVTKESADAYARHQANIRWAKRIAHRDEILSNALAYLTEQINGKGHRADYNAMNNLLEAQAQHRILVEFAHYAADAEEGKDLVDVKDHMAKMYTAALLSQHRHSALSRSTSVMSNLIDDVDTEAMAKFIDDARWNF